MLISDFESDFPFNRPKTKHGLQLMDTSVDSPSLGSRKLPLGTRFDAAKGGKD